MFYTINKKEKVVLSPDSNAAEVYRRSQGFDSGRIIVEDSLHSPSVEAFNIGQ